MFSADADVRLARRIRRDTNEKGRDIGAVLDQVATFCHTIYITYFHYFLFLFSPCYIYFIARLGKYSF